MSKDGMNCVKYAVLNRIAMVGCFLFLYRIIASKFMNFTGFLSDPNIFHIYNKMTFKTDKAFTRSFAIIILFVCMLLPIFRTLTAEIASDTILLNFIICQIIYVIDSVRMYILNKECAMPTYSKDKVIPNDESLLISKSSEYLGSFGKISAVIGFILISSRVVKNENIIILHALGFPLYFIIPQMLYNNLQVSLFLNIVLGLIFFTVDFDFFKIYSISAAGVFLLIEIILRLLDSKINVL